MAAYSNGYHESTCGRYVLLPSGLALPVEPILIVGELENRGFKLTGEGDDILITPFSKLTNDDKQRLKTWKRHILALLSYESREAVQ
jgi:hypothetical protein